MIPGATADITAMGARGREQVLGRTFEGADGLTQEPFPRRNRNRIAAESLPWKRGQRAVGSRRIVRAKGVNPNDRAGASNLQYEENLLIPFIGA